MVSSILCFNTRNEPLKQGISLAPARPGQTLRMKLHPQHRQATMFDPFCKSLRRPSGGCQVMSQEVHRLMVGTVDHGTRPQKLLQQASRLTADRVIDIFLSLVAHPPSGLQVLDQRASQKHVEHLHPPANSQHWAFPGKEGLRQSQLRPVSLPVRWIGTPVLLSKQDRIHISPATQHQSIAAGIRYGTNPRNRNRSRSLYRADIAFQSARLAGNLDLWDMLFSLVVLKTHSAISAWAVRRRTSAAMRSTAPSMPVTLELMVRSYRRISPQV